jgi:hypothetical protein
MDKAEEQTLVRRLSRFDEDAWVAFCTEFGSVLTQYVHSQFGCDTHRAEEIVESLLSRSRESFRSVLVAKATAARLTPGDMQP